MRCRRGGQTPAKTTAAARWAVSVAVRDSSHSRNFKGLEIPAAINRLKIPRLDISQELRPDPNAFSEDQRIRMRRGFFGAGENMKAPKHDAGAA